MTFKGKTNLTSFVATMTRRSGVGGGGGMSLFAIETDDRLLTGYKPSMFGYGKKPSFTTLQLETRFFAITDHRRLVTS